MTRNDPAHFGWLVANGFFTERGGDWYKAAVDWQEG